MDDSEDWETSTNRTTGSLSTEIKQPEDRGAGKIFGSRGRGFAPPSNISLTKVGVRQTVLTNENSDDWQNAQEKKCGKKSKAGEINEMKPKPKSKYIKLPEEPTENENEIFGTGISSGINFSKYDDIEVNVSGENPPLPINSFDEAALQPLLIDLIRKCNYNKPTPIQKYAIPIIMSRRDMMACAQTGSGKTAAFLIPIIHELLNSRRELDISGVCKPQALIVSPTRELTIQIFNEARKFSHGSFLKVAIAYGGTSLSYQIQNIMKGCHILVATLGRLMDFQKKGKVEFSEIRFMVLDEADQMLDVGFLRDVESLLTYPTTVFPTDRQMLMFSATYPEEIQRLAEKFLNNYLFVAVGIVGGACLDVEQRFFCVKKFEKRSKLVELLSEMGGSKCLIFVKQRRTTDFLATFLCEKNFPATSIHGDREQREREEALRDFKNGRMDVLVATSVASRGLDIKNIAHVVNFDLPKTIDEYVHRIGRTGRVGNRGLAISFYDPEKDSPIAADLVKILTQVGQTVPEFLKGHRNESSFSDSSKFGGSDFRNKRIVQAKESVFEEEVW